MIHSAPLTLGLYMYMDLYGLNMLKPGILLYMFSSYSVIILKRLLTCQYKYTYSQYYRLRYPRHHNTLTYTNTANRHHHFYIQCSGSSPSHSQQYQDTSFRLLEKKSDENQTMLRYTIYDYNLRIIRYLTPFNQLGGLV